MEDKINNIVLAKIGNDGLLEIYSCNPEFEGGKILKLRNEGYLDFVESKRPITEPGKSVVDTFSVIDGKLVQQWNIVVDKEHINAQIQLLKDELSATDYQITKCYEASLVGESLPYDINTLHNSRQKIREEINALEIQLH